MTILPSSYRDADGFVFEADGKIYRFIRPSYFDDYRCLMESGLYTELTAAGRLISHEEIKNIWEVLPGEGIVLLPEQIPFISYPYEWSFDMWRDAALVTLKTAAASLEKEMILKDATPFNIQFYKGRPVFIDTLSFEKHEQGTAWIAYRQFCECFLAPLLLMHYGHRDMGKLFLAYPEGIPLEIIKSLLPRKAKWNIHVYMHIFLQEKTARKNTVAQKAAQQFPKKKLSLLLSGLEQFVAGLKPKINRSEWDDYYTETVLGPEYLAAKEKAVMSFVNAADFKTVLDLGANDGLFSMLLKDKAAYIIAADADSNCINALYKSLRQKKIRNILPLVSALQMPAPQIGWANEERASFTQRAKADLLLMLALIHHLAISANLPLEKIALWLKEAGHYIIIEFVPKSDDRVQLLLKNREDIFSEYSIERFRDIFSRHFDFLREEKIGDTERVLFLLKNNNR